MSSSYADCPTPTENNFCLGGTDFTYKILRKCFDDVVVPICKANYQMINFVGPTGTTISDLLMT
jgi:hypothetical protein